MFNFNKFSYTKNGDYMRKFLSTFILLIIYLSLKDSEIKTVFNEINDSDVYKNYCLEISNLNTFNFNDYFNSIEVIGIIPNINKLYQDKINFIYLDNDIEKFKRLYIRKFKEKGYYKEANKFLILPIKIEQVLVCSSINEIYDKIDGDIVNISESCVKKFN